MAGTKAASLPHPTCWPQGAGEAQPGAPRPQGHVQRPGNPEWPLWGLCRVLRCQPGSGRRSPAPRRGLWATSLWPPSHPGFYPKSQAVVGPKGSPVCSTHVPVTFLGACVSPELLPMVSGRPEESVPWGLPLAAALPAGSDMEEVS